MFSRKPHPARASRIATLGLSSTALLTMVASFGINANAAAIQEANATQDVPTSQTPTPIAPSAVPAVTKSATPQATATPVKKVKTTKKVKAAKPATKKVKKTKVVKKTVASKPVAKKTTAATPTQPVVQPSAPAPKPVVKTCWTPKHHVQQNC